MSENKIQFLAYYLPQYHPIEENDKWWGKGFTEWTNVAKAKPLFKGHYQPILPADLGFYDLRVPEVQEQQAQLAKEYGIDGFIYYQYWFGNSKMLLERPAEAMLNNKKIDLSFCFCWANETWKGIWHGLDNGDILIEQTYQGEEGYRAYFEYLLPFFKDERYIKVDNKPMFHIYRIEDIPDWNMFLELFDDLAIQNGFKGIHFIVTVLSKESSEILKNRFVYGQVGTDVFRKMRYSKGFLFENVRYLGWLERKIKVNLGFTNEIGKRLKPLIFDYDKAVSHFSSAFHNEKYIPCVFPNWDNSARSGKKSLIFVNANPNSWRKHLEKTVKELLKNPKNPQIIIIKSWNEWAEGNHLEPDVKFGLEWLKTVKEVKKRLYK
ncbi:glycoside hydrolase family 99-like domain-containing protein [Flavobacterium sp. LS1R47]|uniref:Glycoside hydrolase family 99-like domain-containing protein n=1 Tax=Flavobacterium frigoritolerans TaxID=2987686 RepID=A0A9X2ZHI7_9FLAO|nr:glycoside hydrolase family 99-like domain-containing protein [Flavobacterium frigoritolerans]MCV9931254.1 glycoside hydrolase family 99-like domain-containing protein [Flavobacterium frigoritolerans]